MNKSTTTQSIPAVEQQIREALAKLETAPDELAAAEAYALLRSNIEDYLRRSAGLRNEFYKLKNTVTQQAHTLAEIELAEAIGEKAPGEAKTAPAILDFPETLTVQQSPDFFFIRLSYGLVNIRHIVELDVKTRTLFTTTGTRNLHADDIRTLLFHLKMYRPS